MFTGKCNHTTICQDTVLFNWCKNVEGWQILLSVNPYCVFEAERDNYLLSLHWSFTKWKPRCKKIHSAHGLKPLLCPWTSATQLSLGSFHTSHTLGKRDQLDNVYLVGMKWFNWVSVAYPGLGAPWSLCNQWKRWRWGRRRNCCGIHPTPDEPGNKICWVSVSDRSPHF